MKKHTICLLTLLSLGLALPVMAVTDTLPEEAVAAEPTPADQMDAIMKEISVLYNSRTAAPEDYTPLLDKMNALYATLAPDDALMRGRILGSMGGIYQNVLFDSKAARDTYQRLADDLAGTPYAEKALQMVQMLEVQASLVPGEPFPPFRFTGLDGEPVNLTQYLGKVLLVDFWATWCPPCVAEMPHVIEVYQEFHDKGFEIVGISLDKSKESLENYIQKNGMDWPQYFDGKGWDNELSNKYGVSSIPATFLIGPEGKIIAADLRGDDLRNAVSKAVEGLN
jgi:peroxiredoxin